VGETFGARPESAEGSKERRFLAGLPRFLQTRVYAKQKSLQRFPKVRFSDSV